jgi:hypothetical protein
MTSMKKILGLLLVTCVLVVGVITTVGCGETPKTTPPKAAGSGPSSGPSK